MNRWRPRRTRLPTVAPTPRPPRGVHARKGRWIDDWAPDDPTFWNILAAIVLEPGVSFLSYKNGNAAYVAFVAFYAICFVVTWAVTCVDRRTGLPTSDGDDGSEATDSGSGVGLGWVRCAARGPSGRHDMPSVTH